MNAVALAVAYLRRRPLNTVLNMALLAIGVATVLLLMLFAEQLRGALERDARGVDMVVGAKGSPMQLVLSSVFHVDIPTGNIRLDDARALAEDPMIGEAIPLALGDNYRGWRIVGAGYGYPELFGARLARGALWRAPLEATVGARAASDAGLDIGSRFVGAHGVTGGGATHDETPYRVVGVFEPTDSVLDRLILTSVESVWEVHSHHDEAEDEDHGEHGEDHDDAHGEDHDDEHGEDHDDEHGEDHDDEHGEDHDDAHGEDHDDAHGEDYDDEHGEDHDDAHGEDHDDAHGEDHDDEHGEDHDDAHGEDHDDAHGEEGRGEGHDGEALALPRGGPDREVTALLVRLRNPVGAAVLPRRIAAETPMQAALPGFEIARLMQMIGFGIDGFRAFAWVLMASAGLGIFAALSGALAQRRYDIAVMRALGAGRGAVLRQVLLEGCLLAGAGAVLGLALGHAAAEAAGVWLWREYGMRLDGLVWAAGEGWLLLAALALGAAAAAVPALQAWRIDVSDVLARG